MPDAKEVPPAYDNFGWDHFVLTSKEWKNTYMSSQLFLALRESVGDQVAALAIRQLTGIDMLTGADEYGPNWIGIDHSSVYNLPLTFDRSGINLDFYEAFRQFALRDGVVILGGNDNEEGDSHPLLKDAKQVYRVPIERDCWEYTSVARYDDKYNYWTIYNPSTGAKVRFSFGDLDDPSEVTKASKPELVDVKITDFCAKGCAYCYQGSSVTGKHANIGRILWALEELEVFEVAIGGGEPTSHPGFISFLKSCEYHHITPNFSTRNLDWFHNPDHREVLQCCGGVGVSVDDWNTVDKLSRIVEMYDDLKTEQFSIHIIDKTIDCYDLGRIIRRAGDSGFVVTVFGFKRVGRGTEFESPRQCKSWVEVWKDLLKDRDENREKGYYDLVLPKLSVDTSIAQEYQNDLDDLGISRILYDKHEGRYSMYVDLVSGRAGPSSHCGGDEMVEIEDMSAESILRAFQSFSQEE
jgi:hypothetical protein